MTKLSVKSRLVPSWVGLFRFRRFFGAQTLYATFAVPTFILFMQDANAGISPQALFSIMPIGLFIVAERLFFAFCPEAFLIEERHDIKRLSEDSKHLAVFLENFHRIEEFYINRRNEEIQRKSSDLPSQRTIIESLKDVNSGSKPEDVIFRFFKQVSDFARSVERYSFPKVRLIIFFFYILAISLQFFIFFSKYSIEDWRAFNLF